jgi:DNA polymerase elongation subunit (family B)
MPNWDPLDRLLFLDIETAQDKLRYDELSPVMQQHWDRRAQRERDAGGNLLTSASSAEIYDMRAGIFAEFARVVCISCGYAVAQPDGTYHLRLRSFYGPDEKPILEDFNKLVHEHFGGGRRLTKICGHNVREFDYPFIARRLLLHRIPLAPSFDMREAKPWEVALLDTMELWKFGDRKSFTALELLAELLGIPTPKSDIAGKDVSRVFWYDKDCDRIARYCEADVLATARLYWALIGQDPMQIMPSPDNKFTGQQS